MILSRLRFTLAGGLVASLALPGTIAARDLPQPPDASAVTSSGVDVHIERDAVLGACAGLEWPNGTRFVGTFSAHGVVAGPGIKGGTFRQLMPIDVTDPDDPYELPGRVADICVNGSFEGADVGGAVYTLSGHFSGPASAGELLIQNVCTVYLGNVTCEDSTTEPPPGAEAEIVDACGDSPSEQAATYADICSGTFRGLWELVPRDDDPTKETWQLRGIEAELRLHGEVPERPTSVQYAMRWEVDGCTHRWMFNSGLADAGWIAGFAEVCDGGSTGFRTGIPAEHVSVGSDRITIRLMLDEELAPIADTFVLGRELREPSASTFLRLAGSDPVHEGVTGWDSTASGRAFVIGQDRPPDPDLS